MQSDAVEMIPRLGMGTVDLFFTSPPYADQRAYSRIHPDRYVERFLPFAEAMYEATSATCPFRGGADLRGLSDTPARGVLDLCRPMTMISCHVRCARGVAG